MILIQLPNTSPYIFTSGNAGKLLSPSLQVIKVENVNDICICDFITCDYRERVFADPATTDFWKNDKNEFLFKRFIVADTVVMELFKDEVFVTTLNNNALGKFFNGFTGSAEQQLYVGYLLDWRLVEAAHGVGSYQVRTQLTIIGDVTDVQSRVFELMRYSDIAAHKTVRIESTQNGNIIGSEFDFSGLNWQQSVRIPGTFGNPTPSLETDNYTTSTHQVRQITSKMSTQWFIKTRKINYEVAFQLVYNKLLANEILITDYNILAESIWRRQSVFPSEIEKPELSGNPNKIYNITFTDNEDIYKKRNF